MEDDDFDFGNGDLVLQISSIDNKDISNDVVDFGDEEEEVEEKPKPRRKVGRRTAPKNAPKRRPTRRKKSED